MNDNTASVSFRTSSGYKWFSALLPGIWTALCAYMCYIFISYWAADGLGSVVFWLIMLLPIAGVVASIALFLVLSSEWRNHIEVTSDGLKIVGAVHWSPQRAKLKSEAKEVVLPWESISTIGHTYNKDGIDAQLDQLVLDLVDGSRYTISFSVYKDAQAIVDAVAVYCECPDLGLTSEVLTR